VLLIIVGLVCSWAAKEATFKALGTGAKGRARPLFPEIRVSSDSMGAKIELEGSALQLACSQGVDSIQLRFKQPHLPAAAL